MTDFQIAAWTAQPFAVVSRTAAMTDMPLPMGETLGAVAATFARVGAAMERPAWCHRTAFDGRTVGFDAGFAARPQDCDALREAGLSIGETPSGRVMTGWHIGPCDTVSATYASMQAVWVRGAETMWEADHSPPETPPAETRTRVIWPLARALTPGRQGRRVLRACPDGGLHVGRALAQETSMNRDDEPAGRLPPMPPAQGTRAAAAPITAGGYAASHPKAVST